MQQQRDSQRLLVRHVVVGAPAVLAESLAVIGDDDKESVPVQSRCLVLIEERPQKEVVSPKGVEITIQLRIVRIPLWSMPGQQCAPIVRVYGEVRGKKRLRALLRFEPSAGRRQHRIVLVAEIVGLLEPFVAEARGADEVVIPHREDHERAVLDALVRGLEIHRAESVIAQEIGQAVGRDSVSELRRADPVLGFETA